MRTGIDVRDAASDAIVEAIALYKAAGWSLADLSRVAENLWHPTAAAVLPTAEAPRLKLNQREIVVHGLICHVDFKLGHIVICHDGTIIWDQLQAVKNYVWGEEARAIEVFPRAGDLVNSGNLRHLWRLGVNEFCPDLLGHGRGMLDVDSLEFRHFNAWREADAVFK